MAGKTPGKQPGILKYSNVTLKRGTTDSQVFRGDRHKTEWSGCPRRSPLPSGAWGPSGNCPAPFPRTLHRCRAATWIARDLAVPVGDIQAVGGGQSLVVRGQLPVGAHDLELCAGQGLLCDGIVLFNDKASLTGVFDNHRLGIAALPDDYIGRERVDDVPSIRGFDLVNDIGAGRKIGNANFALGVGREDTVGGQRVAVSLTEYTPGSRLSMLISPSGWVIRSR